MHMKFLLASLCLLWGLPAMAQRNLSGELYDYSSVNRAKATYRLSYTSIFVQFQPNVSDADKKEILSKAGLKGNLPAEFATVRGRNNAIKVDLSETGINTPDQLKQLLVALEADAKVVAANPYIYWSGVSKPTNDETMGITSEFYVKLKPGTSLDELKALVAVTNTTIKEKYPFAEGIYILNADKNAKGNALEMANQFYESTKFEYSAVDFDLKLSFTGYNVTPITEEEAFKLKGIKGVKGTTATVNDPFWPWQYSHRITPAGIPGGAYPVNQARAAFPGNPAPNASDQPWNMDASMRVDEAWDIATTAGAGVKVAVLDNGTERNHPDLAANIAPIGYDPANPGNLGDAAPGGGDGDHGTNCAGVIAAVANNGIGCAGVANRATIVPIQIFTTGNAGLAQAVDWSWQPQNGNCDVSSNSYGFNAAATNPNFDIPIITDAFNRALSQGRGGKGQVVIASAGNSNTALSGYPARIPGIISSIASNAGATRAGFSQYGIGADVAAPGNQILTTDRRDIAPYQGFTAGQYCIIDGTSFSCPNTAGVAALVVGVDNTLTREQVRQFIEGTARKVVGGGNYVCNADQPNGSWSTFLGYGIVDAYEAVKQAANISGPYCSGNTILSSPSGTLEDGSFAREYGNNQNCTWTIAPPNAARITVNFSAFQFGTGDRLELYNTSSTAGTPFAVYTAANPAPPQAVDVVSTTGVLTMRMVTDGSGKGQGFRLCYNADVPAGNFTVNPTSACVGRPVVFTPTSTGTVNEYRWNFGAGAVPATATTATLQPVTVSYTTAGLKTVTLTLVGPGGSVDVVRQNVVNVAAPANFGMNETLEAGLPLGWTVVPSAAAATSWRVVGYNNPALRIGGFAESVRGFYFDNYNQNIVGSVDYFVLPPMDFSGITNPVLAFDVAHNPYVSLGAQQDRLGVQVSTNCGATWTTVYLKQSIDANPNLSLATLPGTTAEFLPTSASEWRRDVVSLAVVANQPNVLIRFANVNDFGNNIFVDNINITTTTPPGLLNVFSATGNPNTAALTTTAVSASQINLTWSDNSNNETGFVVQRALASQPNNYVTVAALAPNTTSYTDAGLASGTAYRYRVFAVGPQGVSNAAVPATFVVTTQSATEPFTLFSGAATQPAALSTFWSENFNGCTLPAGWTRQTLAGNATFDFWRISNAPLMGRTAQAPFAGCFASFDSDAFSAGGGAEDITLESPTINATGLTQIFLSFDAFFRTGFGGRFTVEVFNPNTSAWVSVLDNNSSNIGSFTGTTFTPASIAPIDISSLIANTTTGRIRFRWRGDWSWAAAVDNVQLQSSVPTPINLTAAITAPTQATLRWIDQNTGETGFDIERSTTNATTGFTVVGTSAALAGIGLQGTFVDNTVVAGTRYWYRVRARLSPTSTSDPSNVVNVMAIAAPTNLTAAANQFNITTVELNWTNNATNATGTVVERSSTPSVGFAPIANLGVVNTFSNSGLAENTRYFYRVATLAAGQQSDYSNEAVILTGITPPSNLTATATTANVVVLRWTDNSANESGYRIERQNLATGAFALLANVPANSNEFTDVNLNPDTQYIYRVSAIGLAGNTAVYTSNASALTFPATPTGLIARGVNSSSVDLAWVDNSTTEFGYEIWRSTSATGTYTLVDRITRQNMTSFTDNTVAHNVMYYYRVRAFREAGAFSAVSNTAVGITKFDAPELRLVVAANKRVVLEWTNNTPDAEGFVLERTSMLDNLIPTGFAGVATLSRGATTYTDTNVQPGVTYFYRLRAFNNTTKAVSANSNIISAKLTPGIPSTPLNLIGVAGNAQVMLSWNSIADLDLVNYEVYYSSENTLRKLAGTTKDTKMTIVGLENGILHTFVVRAINAAGLRSEFSNTVDLRPSIVLSTNDDAIAASFNVYPNPNEGSFKLTFSKEAKPTMLTVTNAAGQVVFEKSISEFSGSEDINLSNVAAGLYIVNIVTEKASYQRRVSVIK